MIEKEEIDRRPNYKLIFLDIIEKKNPQKMKDCESILKKDDLSVFDIIKLNDIIFGLSDKSTENFNQKQRSYKKRDILEIINYQKKNHLNNIQTALQFKTSRNTIAKWNRLYGEM
ncbi:helix-turn-helix domain-containing protein [Chryseobacterium sp. Mn2064]|uniref:helix-turn-helix domain-containing protein n=1 Tax=Chryseobacterium sp. Mn2064 TaxID=3395263 RepID=UPI003BE2A630